MTFSTQMALGILAGILQFVGYATYFHDVMRSGVKPNPASWLIWSYGNALVCASFLFLNQDLSAASDVLPVVCAITCVFMALSFFFLGKLRPLDSFEKFIISLDLLVTIVWVSSEFGGPVILSLGLLHVVLLASAVVSFVPLYREVVRDHMAERPRSWLIWTLAYVLLIFIVLQEEKSFVALSYPVLYGVLHFVVVLLSSRNSRKILRLSAS